MYTLTPILVCRSHEGQNAHGWCTLTSLAERTAPNNSPLQLDGTPTAAHDILLSIVTDGRGGCSGRFESNEHTITILTSVLFLLPGKHSTGSGPTHRTVVAITSTDTLRCPLLLILTFSFLPLQRSNAIYVACPPLRKQLLLVLNLKSAVTPYAMHDSCDKVNASLSLT